jgi:hypothetical protein
MDMKRRESVARRVFEGQRVEEEWRKRERQERVFGQEVGRVIVVVVVMVVWSWWSRDMVCLLVVGECME